MSDGSNCPPPAGGEATPWFLGKMEREKAEKILKEVRRGREG